MVVRLFAAAALGAATLSTTLKGQDRVAAESLVERAAVKAALAEAGLPESGLRIVIDPNASHPDEAPGFRGVGLRSTARSAYLRQSFSAMVRPRAEVLSCVKHECTMRSADVIVALSNPQVVGDDASVTVTLERSGPRGLFYVTNRFYLRRVDALWKVDRVQQLGIS